MNLNVCKQKTYVLTDIFARLVHTVVAVNQYGILLFEGIFFIKVIRLLKRVKHLKKSHTS